MHVRILSCVRIFVRVCMCMRTMSCMFGDMHRTCYNDVSKRNI
jgi:hypothetical protein